MKHILCIATLCAFAISLTAPATAEEETCKALFVHTASEVSYDGTSITMKGASPMVTFFCDRPVRFAGHLTVASFLQTVSEGDDPFSADPPNAVVSIVPGEDMPVDVVVTLNSRPSVDGDTLIYEDIAVLDGQSEPVSGAGTLFIDHFGHPMSPGSAAGVHRRQDRRETRDCQEADADPGTPGIDCACGAGLVCH
jgi:hypothetical protein